MRSTRLRGAALAVSVLLVALFTQLIGSSSAQADNGDGYGNCYSGELCYSKDNPATSYQRDYWYSGNDSESPAYWYHVAQGIWTAVRVLNSASSMNNRDTGCWVRVVDWNSTGTAMINYQDFAKHPTTNQWVGFKSVLNDHNDAHLRCGSY